MVIDGDTVRFPRLGFDARLARIDAPEKGEPGAEGATRALAQRLRRADHLEIEGLETGYHGRPIVEIYADGENVSDWMLHNGLAEPC